MEQTSYKKMYLTLFNVLTDVIGCLEQGKNEEAKTLLVTAQQEAEEIFISGDITI